MYIVTCVAAILVFAVECHAGSDYVTITLPEKVILQSIRNILPLDITPQGDLVQGSLVLNSVDQFTLGENSARLHGVILGKDLVASTKFGNQEIRLKIGEVQVPLVCDFTFRFERKEKKFYFTPHFEDPSRGKAPDQVNKVLPVLALLNNREFPVPLANLKTMRSKIGKRQLSLKMEPVDIQVLPSQVVLKMAPKLNAAD
jgi:hypothetical protein